MLTVIMLKINQFFVTQKRILLISVSKLRHSIRNTPFHSQIEQKFIRFEQKYVRIEQNVESKIELNKIKLN